MKRLGFRSSLLVVGLGLTSLLASSLLAGRAASGTTTTVRPARKPPFYSGRIAPGDVAIAHLPIAFSGAEPSLPAGWAPEPALRRLAENLTSALEGLERSRLLVGPTPPGATAPHAYLGCEEDSLVPGECDEEARQNVLATTSGNREWRTWITEAAAQSDVGAVLVVRLEIAPHWIAQRGFKGRKEVRLGTDHVQPLPWLTSLDTPVWVVQLTGAIVDGQGKVLRSGAEGIQAVRTPFRASVLGAQRLLQEQDVEAIRTELRRDDLPGRPLVWEVALARLVEQLTAPTPDS